MLINLQISKRARNHWFTSHFSLITSHSRLWNRQPGKNPLNDRFARDRFGFGFITDDDAMPQNIRPDAFDILGRDVAAPVQERVGPRAEREINRGAWRRAITNQSF